MDYTKKTRDELVALCKERKLKGYSNKKKDELVAMLSTEADVATVAVDDSKVCRLNYIGSKFQLLDWLTENIKAKTGLTSFQGKTVADLFAGTGIVSYHFRKAGATVISNDAELYSAIITHAFSCSAYTPRCKKTIADLMAEIEGGKHLVGAAGFVTRHYTPFEGGERKFFTIENGRRIDYLRGRIEAIRKEVTNDEYKFLLASLIISADWVSNVPAVYGCFLKNFKAKAVKNLILTPVHTRVEPAVAGSATYNQDVLSDELLAAVKADITYLDPPYNNRQYSKNYFPLNIIATGGAGNDVELKGKTGIPTDCFLSPFSKKGEVVEQAFEKLFRELKSRWVIMSYNSESTVPKEKILELMGKYGTASVVERDYKRFKSFEYNQDKLIKEYLFCLEKK